ncbi:insulinase family protein [bacterium]|jgi:predicted Zn-dependent peptidase|nr:insulinase family protein [bacterium]
MYKKTTLKNGLRIITVPQKESRAVTVLVMTGTGSKYEQKKFSGISHFAEHMMFKGTKKRKGPMKVSGVMDEIGGDMNAFTGEEYTGYYAKVDATHFDIAVDWISDIFINSTIPDTEIEKERGVIIEEIKMFDDNPMRNIGDAWRKALYGDQPAGWFIGGIKESVSNIKRGDIINYIHSQYTAKNTVVCVVGNIKEKKAIESVKNCFSKIPTATNIKKVPVIESTEPNVYILDKKTKQTTMALGVRGYDHLHKDRYVLDIMATLLGGMMSSRLFDEVREKLGAAYYVGTYNESESDTGSFSTFAGIDSSKLEIVIKTILKEYNKLTKVKVSEKELRKIKDHLRGKIVLGMESLDAQASFYCTQELLKNRILSIEEIIKEIEKVKASDIMRVAKDIFKEEKLNLAIIGPYKGKEEEFKKLLKF